MTGTNIVFAEVLDKEPSLFSVWATFLTVGILGYLLCRFRWWLVGIVVPVALVLSVVWLSELLDPFVGPAMWNESRSYVLQSYAAMLISVALPCIGALLQRRHRIIRARAVS